MLPEQLIYLKRISQILAEYYLQDFIGFNMANVEHSVLTGSDLHEPKAIAAAAANRVYVSDGAGSGSWTTVPAAAITAAGVLVFQSQLFHIRDERSSGTDGDNMTVSTWNTRTLNTEKTDELSITLGGSTIPLLAGTYYIEVDAVTYFTGTSVAGVLDAVTSKLRLRNITDSTTLVVGLSTKFQENDDGGGNNQFCEWMLYPRLSGRFTLAGAKSVEIQNWVTNALSSPTTKGGKAISSGENEVYTDLRLWKLS